MAPTKTPVSERKVLPPAVEQALELQRNIKSANAEAERLEARIDECQSAAPNSDEIERSVADLEQRLEETLAAHALGQVTDKELLAAEARFNEAKLAQQKSAQEIKPLGERILRTISGLRKLVPGARKRAADLEAEKEGVLLLAIRSEAELIAADYLRSAEDLKQAHIRIMGLSAAAQRVSGDHRAGFGLSASTSLLIPMFNLNAFRGLGYANEHGGILWSAQKEAYGKTFDHGAVEEAQRLRDLGLEI